MRIFATVLGPAANRRTLVTRPKASSASRCGGCENGWLTSISMGAHTYRIQIFAIARKNLLRFGSLHSRSWSSSA
jgi:hypothetical protein